MLFTHTQRNKRMETNLGAAAKLIDSLFLETLVRLPAISRAQGAHPQCSAKK